MAIDFILAAALLLSVLAGVLRGALLEVLSLGALAAALIFCQWLGAFLTPSAALLMPDSSALSIRAVATVFAGLMILLVGTAATALIARLARKGGKAFTRGDRIVGGALGGVRAVVIWLVAACFVPPAEAPAATPLRQQMRQSLLLAAANRTNPLLALPLVKDLRTFDLVLHDPARQSAFFALPETQAFLAHPLVAQAVAEGNLEPAAARADLVALLESPPFQAALLQPGVLSAFRRALAASRG